MEDVVDSRHLDVVIFVIAGLFFRVATNFSQDLFGIKPAELSSLLVIGSQDTTIELIYGEPIYAVVIKNKKLADTARKQFEVFWKIAK